MGPTTSAAGTGLMLTSKSGTAARMDASRSDSESAGATTTAPRTSWPATTTCSTSITRVSARAENIRAVTPVRSTPTTVAWKVVRLTGVTLPAAG